MSNEVLNSTPNHEKWPSEWMKSSHPDGHLISFLTMHFFLLLTLNSSLAFSTSILDITNVMISVIATGINKYIVCSMLIADSGWTAAFPLYPASLATRWKTPLQRLTSILFLLSFPLQWLGISRYTIHQFPADIP